MSDALPPDPPRNRTAWARAWPHLRAGLVAAHIGAVIVLAIPEASGVPQSREAWKNPTVQAELVAWADRLTELGIDTDAPTLEDDVYEAARTWTELVTTVRAPVQPYATYLGVRQSWRMFVAPHRYPATLHVELEQDGRWQPLYDARSHAHGWRADQLDHVRVRAVLFRYGWSRYARHYQAFARWLAARAAHDFPSATRVRIQMEHFRTPTPQEARAGTIPAGTLEQTIVLELEARR